MDSILFRSNKNLREKKPNESSCNCCGKPWSFVEIKLVPTGFGRGTFATCLECWYSSTLDELKQYYAECYISQKESLVGTNHSMVYSLQHLLDCVENEYFNR